MKKFIYLLIILSVLSFSGCKKEEEMPDFIPVQSPEEDLGNTGDDEDNISNNEQDEEDEAIEKDEVTPTQPIVIGKTTTMYVRLYQYGGSLNIRPTPSTDGAPVGFLVHAEAVEVIEIKDGWASFLYNGAICYINDDFLVDKRPAYLDPPTPTPKPLATPTPVPDKPHDI